MVREYYRLTKPGIIYGNALTAAAGFCLASRGHIQVGLLLATLAGISLVIASACVFNNYIDRGIDAAMARTKQRALVAGRISAPAALTYATLLALVGVADLVRFTNTLTVAIGLGAFLVYVVLYGITKRRTIHGTAVGSISGAAPVVAGYTAVVGRIDSAAVILFAILVLWQMPHFYAIAMYRLDDYTSAKLPVLPVKAGLAATKRQIVLYIVGFIIAVTLLTATGYTGYTYLIVMTILGLVWLGRGLKGWRAPDEARWARGMFFFSLIIIVALSVMLSLGTILP